MPEDYCFHRLQLKTHLQRTIPLFIIRCFYTSGHHLAAIQRYRARHRLLARLILSLSFLAIAVLLIINRI